VNESKTSEDLKADGSHFIFCMSRLLEESIDYQRALLLSTIGDDACRVEESSHRYENDQSLAAIIDILEQYCV